MLALPPVAPATGWCSSLRLPRDHYVRLDSNDYSVHPASIGRRVLVRADLQRVQAFSDGQLVAELSSEQVRHDLPPLRHAIPCRTTAAACGSAGR